MKVDVPGRFRQGKCKRENNYWHATLRKEEEEGRKTLLEVGELGLRALAGCLAGCWLESEKEKIITC